MKAPIVILTALTLYALAFIHGVEWQERAPAKIKEVPVLVEVPVETVKYVRVEVPVPYPVKQPVFETIELKPVASEEELKLAYDFIVMGRASHQQWLDNPWMYKVYQVDLNTGLDDQMCIDSYNLIERLLKRAYGR